MWIETCDGELVNLDRVGLIRIRFEAHVVAYTDQLDRDGNEIGYVLFGGTLTECTTYMATLKERLRGGARKLTG